jgi:phosphoglycolate phosphatase-like HAD superfamily hydrolase
VKLLLFDIDLTLINSGAAGRRAMTQAFEKVFRKQNGFVGVDFAGRTDPLILKDALAHNGLEWDPRREESFKKTYFGYLKTEIQKPNRRKRMQPGVSEILNILSGRKDITLGLLTGNWYEGAMTKLGYFDLTRFFPFGAFADDSEIRAELPPVAVQKCKDTTGVSIGSEDVFIIGDTPLDVACAKPFGAKSIAVATGLFSTKELEEAHPDYLFTDFSDYQKFLMIFNEN